MKRRTWLLRVVVVTLIAGPVAIGAYVKSQQDCQQSMLNPFTFAYFRLVSRERVSSTSNIFKLQPAKPDDNRQVYESAWRTGIWSVMFKQPQLQIGRHYTPLPPVDQSDDEVLRFFIRRDPHGEMSRYLNGLSSGSKVEIRGPQIEFEISSDVRDILFIAGGTGIAPALQAAYTLLSRTSDTNKPRMHILWATRRREDCLGGSSNNKQTGAPRSSWLIGFFGTKPSSPAAVILEPPTSGAIVKQIESLKSQYPGQLTVRYFVDEENTFIGKDSILDFTNSESSQSSHHKKLILISGPEGFISYLAGPKVWARGRELQGPLQGVIKELDPKDWSVWKL
ncbi:hypothetical protein V8E54_008603 [Elaphomyces granulatus]|jgi:ferredoxin-NADP reductase